MGGAGVGGMDIMSVCRYRSQYAESSSAAAASSRILLANSLSIPPFSPSCLSSRTFRTRLASTPPMLLVVAEMARAAARTAAEILMVTSSCRTYV